MTTPATIPGSTVLSKNARPARAFRRGGLARRTIPGRPFAPRGGRGAGRTTKPSRLLRGAGTRGFRLGPTSRAILGPLADPGEPLLTIEDAAELSRVHPKTIERAIARGEIVASDLGEPGARRPVVRIEPAELRGWWQRRRRQPAKPLKLPTGSADPVAAGRLTVTDEMGR